MSIRDTLVAHRDEIIASYQSGASTVAIGKQYGCSNASIYVFLRDCGVELRQVANKYDHLIPAALDRLSGGESIDHVAKSLSIPRSTLQRIAKQHGHDSSQHLKRCAVHLEDHAVEIEDAYCRGESQSAIAATYGCDPSNISRLLQRHGVETRFHYDCDNTFFDRIDSEVKAYTLGFFVADGYNHGDGVVSIRIVDRDVLEQIRAAICYTGPIGTKPPPPEYPQRQVLHTLEIASKQMCESLARLGCPTNKSFLTRFPTESEIPHELLVHYVRGVFDGDGSLYHSGNGWNICVAGTTALLDPMRHHIHQTTGVMFSIYPHGKVYLMKVGGNRQVGLVLDWLYRYPTDATIYMQRKYDKYLTFCEERESKEQPAWLSASVTRPRTR